MKTLFISLAILTTASFASADEYVKVSDREVKRIQTITVEEVYNLDTLLSEKKNLRDALDALNLKIDAVRAAGAIARSEKNDA